MVYASIRQQIIVDQPSQSSAQAVGSVLAGGLDLPLGKSYLDGAGRLRRDWRAAEAARRIMLRHRQTASSL
jgi:hypothetical protein